MFSFHSLPHVAVFLSTPSGWRATVCFFASLFGADFYPRPPGGGRPSASGPVCLFAGISIHALRVEGDVPDLYIMQRGGWISIHALRVEGDKRLYCFGVLKAYFYPRPPGGGRH